MYEIEIMMWPKLDVLFEERERSRECPKRSCGLVWGVELSHRLPAKTDGDERCFVRLAGTVCILELT